MARKRRKSSAKSGGSTLTGIMIGLILGLAAAVAVALFVTKVPMPFVDRASREPAKTLLPGVRDAPDPNLGLYSRDTRPGATPVTPPPAPGPGQPISPPVRSGDHLGDFIANLVDSSRSTSRSASPATPSPAPNAPTPPVTAAPTPGGAGGADTQVAVIPGVTEPSRPVPPAVATPSSGAQGQYLLQAGAFRSAEDAEAVKARILLMGLPAHVEQAQVGGSTLNRVRVGPFDGLDAMNNARAQLGTQKIESTVIKQ